MMILQEKIKRRKGTNEKKIKEINLSHDFLANSVYIYSEKMNVCSV